jgi:hypothetical protein
MEIISPQQVDKWTGECPYRTTFETWDVGDTSHHGTSIEDNEEIARRSKILGSAIKRYVELKIYEQEG